MNFMYARHPDELLFEKLKYLYEPIPNMAIVLDLELYKKGITQIYVFDIESKIYYEFINSDMASTDRETIVWTSLKNNFVTIYTKQIRLSFDLDKNEIDDYEDLNLRSHFVKLDMRQQAELLVYELNHPKPEKPDC